MCIIAYKPKNTPIWDDETIETMFENNHDGAGVMYAEDGKVHIDKGYMTADSLLEHLHSRDFTDVPLFLHCRIGTSGGNTPINCHPYPIRKRNECHTTCDVGFMHNGIMYSYNPPYGSKLNDTQEFKNKVLNKLPPSFMHNAGIADLLQRTIGKSNRLAFLNEKGETLLIGDWIEDGDYLYSNGSYHSYRLRSTYQPKQMSLDYTDYDLPF